MSSETEAELIRLRRKVTALEKELTAAKDQQHPTLEEVYDTVVYPVFDVLSDIRKELGTITDRMRK